MQAMLIKCSVGEIRRNARGFVRKNNGLGGREQSSGELNSLTGRILSKYFVYMLETGKE